MAPPKSLSKRSKAFLIYRTSSSETQGLTQSCGLKDIVKIYQILYAQQIFNITTPSLSLHLLAINALSTIYSLNQLQSGYFSKSLQLLPQPSLHLLIQHVKYISITITYFSCPYTSLLVNSSLHPIFYKYSHFHIQLFIIMRSASKEVYYQSWQEIHQSVKQLLGEPHRFQQQIRNIVTSAFGSDTHTGIISNRIAYYHQKSPLYWAEEAHQIIRLFSRSSDLLSSSMGIISSADYPVQIEPELLPKSVLAEFPPRGDKNSSLLKSLKRERGDQFFINTWQWFWVNVAYALVHLPEVQQNRTFLQEERQEEMFYLLSRNPILQLVRLSLIEYNNKDEQHLLERMKAVFELFIIEELLGSTETDQSHPQFKYELKSQNLATLFLLINSSRKSTNGEIFQKYHQFFQKATQKFSNISTNDNNNLRNLIRTWIFLLTREHGVDHVLVQQLENANPESGWYRLERCPHQEWIKGIFRTQLSTKDIPTITAVRSHIYQILKNHSQWNPGFSFLIVLEQFYELDRIRLSNYIKRPQQKEQDQIIYRAFEKNLSYLAQNGADISVLVLFQKRLNDKFEWKLPINVNFAERSQQAKRKLSKTSRENIHSLRYQNPRSRNVWEHPCQQNQFQILLKGTKWIATQLDKVIPGHSKRSNPCLNIRILANPIVFAFLLLIILLSVRLHFE